MIFVACSNPPSRRAQSHPHQGTILLSAHPTASPSIGLKSNYPEKRKKKKIPSTTHPIEFGDSLVLPVAGLLRPRRRRRPLFLGLPLDRLQRRVIPAAPVEVVQILLLDELVLLALLLVVVIIVPRRRVAIAVVINAVAVVNSRRRRDGNGTRGGADGRAVLRMERRHLVDPVRRLEARAGRGGRGGRGAAGRRGRAAVAHAAAALLVEQDVGGVGDEAGLADRLDPGVVEAVPLGVQGIAAEGRVVAALEALFRMVGYVYIFLIFNGWFGLLKGARVNVGGRVYS